MEDVLLWSAENDSFSILFGTLAAGPGSKEWYNMEDNYAHPYEAGIFMADIS